MDKGQRFIGCLLVVIAALLAVNIFAKTEQRAEAQYGAAGPVEPTVVAGNVALQGNVVSRQIWRGWRFWSDGRVDTMRTGFSGLSQCDPETCDPVVILPGSCSSDIDRNGQVEFRDLLNVLSDWGPCE